VQTLEPRVLLAAALGSEFQVNTTTVNSQRTFAESPQSVATDANGNFVVTWASFGQDGNGDGVYAQRYNAAGAAQGSEFRVNSFTTGSQLNSTVAMDADGDFVVTWTSYGQDGDGNGIYAQRYDAAGLAQGSEFRANTFTTDHQRYSTVAMDADGDFVITWSSNTQDGSNFGIYAQRYNAAGIAQGSEFQVNTFTTGQQQNSTVAMDADGDFVVTWSSNGQDGSSFGIYAQQYNAAGVADGSEFRVNTFTTDEQVFSTVALDADGDFVVSWTSNTQDGSGSGVYAQRYNADAVAQGSEFRVNTFTTVGELHSTVTADTDGNFVVAWSSANQDGDSYGVYAQLYNAAGVAQGSEFRVNTYTTQNQRFSTVAMDADGDFVVVWSSLAQDSSGYGVYAQRYAAGTAPTINDAAFTISENRPVGYVVGTITGTDPDAGDSLTYAITAGNTGNAFAINSATGQITVNSVAPINFELNPTFSLTIEATDTHMLSDTATVTVNLNNLNEAPAAFGKSFSMSENRPVGYVVGNITTSDQDAGQTLSYSITGGNTGNAFAINSMTGQITVNSVAPINFEVNQTFNLQVTATDNGTPQNSRVGTAVINLLDLNEQPFLNPQTFTLSENRPMNQFVGQVLSYDADFAQTRSFSITAGNTGNAFSIDSETGSLRVNSVAAINFEINPTFSLTVRVADNGTPQQSRSATITINLTNLNEQPFLSNQTIGNIPENSPNGAVAGTVGAYDQDAGQTLSYAITGGNTGNAFAINAATGQVAVNNQAALDFETTPTFNLQITVTDNGSPQQSRTATAVVNLIDQSEPVPGPVAFSSRLQPRDTVVQPTTAEQTLPTAAAVPAAQDDGTSDDAPGELYSFLLAEPLPVDDEAESLAGVV